MSKCSGCVSNWELHLLVFSLADSPEATCDDQTCVNRVMHLECTAEECPAGIWCRNQRFQKQEFADVEVIKTEHKGFGLQAKDDITS